MVRPADATPDQRRAYEEACLSSLRRILDEHGHDLFNGRRVTKTSLRGDYPKTEVVVRFLDRTGATGSEAFDLWHDDPPGNVGDCREAAMTAGIIWVNVAGM